MNTAARPAATAIPSNRLTMCYIPFFKTCLRLSLPVFVILMLPALHARAADTEPKQIDQIRQQFLVGNNEGALESVQTYLNTAVDRSDKDVATILEAQILMLTKGKGNAASEELMKTYKPDTSNPRAGAELLRLKALQARQTPKDELAAYQELLQTYPDQFSGYDLYGMTATGAKLSINKYQRNHFIKQVFDPAAAHLGDSPLVSMSKTFMMHWQDNATEGVAMMRKAEKEVQEPLLSLVREKELTFLHGDRDNREKRKAQGESESRSADIE